MTEPREKCPGGLDPELLLAYLEGGLERSVRREVEEHLKGCSFCSKELELMGRMGSLLSSHPEVFHPDEEELYRLVAVGEDRDGLIAGHLETCADCREEAEMLRENLSQEKEAFRSEATLPAYLAAELDRFYPTESSHRRTWAGLPAALGQWLTDLFRRPILAMGTAAALLLVAVLVIPMWRTFKSVPHPAQQSETLGSLQHMEGRVVPAEGKRKRKVEIPYMGSVAPSPEAEGAKKTAPHQAATPVRSFVAPPAPLPSSSVPSAKGRVGDESTDRLQERVGGASRDALSAAPEPKTHMTERARKSPAREENLEKDQQGRTKPGKAVPSSALPSAPGDKEAAEPVEGKVEAAARPLPNVNVPRQDRVLSASVPDGQEAPSKPRVRVTVSIVDPQGRAIPGVRFMPPREMESRYTFLSEESRGKLPEEKPSTTTAGTSAFIRPGRSDADGGLLIRVRVTESGSLYDLKADLMTAGSDRVTKRIEALGVVREDLDGKISSLVSSLLE